MVEQGISGASKSSMGDQIMLQRDRGNVQHEEGMPFTEFYNSLGWKST